MKRIALMAFAVVLMAGPGLPAPVVPQSPPKPKPSVTRDIHPLTNDQWQAG